MASPKRDLKLAIPILGGIAFAGLTAVLFRQSREVRSVGVRAPPGEKRPKRFSALKIKMAYETIGAFPLWATTPLVRSWHLRWGATDAEVAGEMLGDRIVPRAQFNATRAITIEVPPEQVWPWIVQLGYRRGGFYTYDLVDNAGIPSADKIVEELAVGDLIPMFHEVHGLAIAYKVDSFQKNEWMIWVHRPHENEAPALQPSPDGVR